MTEGDVRFRIDNLFFVLEAKAVTGDAPNRMSLELTSLFAIGTYAAGLQAVERNVTETAAELISGSCCGVICADV